MKWCTTAVASASLVSLAIATTTKQAQPNAEAYVLGPRSRSTGGRSSSGSGAVPHIPRQLARHILLQRTSNGDDHSSLSADLPDTIDRDRALEYLNEFGREPLGLFGREGRRPSLVVMLEGVTADNAAELKSSLDNRGQRLSFTIEDPPSAEANRQLLERDLLSASPRCIGSDDIEGVVRPLDKRCWGSQSLFAKYDVAEQTKVLRSIVSNLDNLLDAVEEARLEAMILLMPETSRSDGPKEWTSQQSAASELRRRAPQAEMVLREKLPKKQENSPADFHASSSSSKHSTFSPLAAAPAPRRIPACFATLAACSNATGDCSGHGKCRNKYTGSEETHEGQPACFTCFCLPTKDEARNETTYWGGRTCQKQDVSTPFWLITGITIGLIGMVSLSVGMLFSVGEEKLPGVIGAGVSRTSK